MDMGFETCQQWQAEEGMDLGGANETGNVTGPRHESSSRTLGALMK